jgi:hypothetical protein
MNVFDGKLQVLVVSGWAIHFSERRRIPDASLAWCQPAALVV